MKKYLFLILSVLSIFFISDRVEALSFTLNGEETTVTKENFIYYVYQNYTSYFDNYKYFVASNDLDYNKAYNVYFFNCPYLKDAGFPEKYYHPVGCQVYRIYTKSLDTEFVVKDNGTYKYLNMGGLEYLLYSNYNILSAKDNSVLFSSNLTKEDLAKGGKKTIYKITYYLNNEVFKEIEVEKGSSHELISYNPPENYSFSGWNTEGLDLSNITSDLNIYGTTSYIRPNMNYSENIDSVIHELSVSILGKNIPVEFDYLYTIMDFIILLVLVLCVISPFIIVMKLLSGRW